MADGPRALLPDEWPQLDALVSTVFRSTMLLNYPQLFNAENQDNLRIIADGGTVVSHVGMIQRPASFLGCRINVACVGAVATNALVGTQPQFRQSPPKRSASINAVYLPASASRRAAVSPPLPAPITTASNVCIDGSLPVGGPVRWHGRTLESTVAARWHL